MNRRALLASLWLELSCVVLIGIALALCQWLPDIMPADAICNLC